MMNRVEIGLLVVGLVAMSGVGGQAQLETSPGRAGIGWGLPSGYIPPSHWRVQIPFQIFNNVYFVGNDNVSSYLITTSDGLVLIDTTNGLVVKKTLEHIRQLGFDRRAIASEPFASITTTAPSVTMMPLLNDDETPGVSSVWRYT